MYRRAVADSLAAVHETVRWASSLASGAGLSNDIRYAVEVCLEEALANLVLHGRVRDGGKGIEVCFRAYPPGAELVLSDRCLPFDSGHAPLPVRTMPGALAVGGQGLRLLRAFSTSLTYNVEPWGNELTMVIEPRPLTPTNDPL